MKKVSLLSLLIALLFGGSLMAQDPVVLINDDFSAYTVGNKIAVEAAAAGNDWWTTWSINPGSAEDGVVADLNGVKCGNFTYGNDQVMIFGGKESSHYELSFDMYIPTGKDAYNNILHIFNGSGSQWATEVYYKSSENGTKITAGGTDTPFECPYDEWFNVKYDIDLDNDWAVFYVAGEMVFEWQFSLKTDGNPGARKLDAMDIYPPTSAAVSDFYVTNITLTLVGGESVPHLAITPDEIEETVAEDESTSVDITIANTGTAIGDWNAWVDFGAGGAGTQTTQIAYHNGSAGNAIGSSGGPYSREMAIRMPGSSYAATSMGMKITSVRFLVGTDYKSADNNYVFRIYGQGANNQPGEKLAEKTVTSSDLGVWIEASFDEDVYMTGQTMWATVGLTQTAGEYPLTMDGGTYPEESDGNWLSTQGGSFEHCYSAGNFAGAWLITVNCQGELIPASWARLSAYEGSVAGGDTQTVTLNLNSIGIEEGDYTATLFIRTNDEDLLETQIPVTLHVDYDAVIEKAASAFNVYPNPTTGMVSVEGENISAIAIYNAAGQLINVTRETTVDMGRFGAGVYYLNIIDSANNTTVQRVVVK